VLKTLANEQYKYQLYNNPQFRRRQEEAAEQGLQFTNEIAFEAEEFEFRVCDTYSSSDSIINIHRLVNSESTMLVHFTREKCLENMVIVLKLAWIAMDEKVATFPRQLALLNESVDLIFLK
jgi:hypothetical protein